MSKILIISIFFGFFSNPTHDHLPPCDAILAQVEISNEPVSRVKIVVEKGKAPLKYIFYKNSGELISKDWQNNTVTGLTTGKYYCTVVDSSNCRKTVEFEIF